MYGLGNVAVSNVPAGIVDDSDSQHARQEDDLISRQLREEHTVDPEEESWLEDWLIDMIPTLKPNDAKGYARNLARIGFDPECVTRSELEIDDLSFMKVLHRRFLYNKISSLS